MDNATIKLYKDGRDIIVVFKNASDDILDVIKKTLEIQMTPILVPDLEEPPECNEEPLDLSSIEYLEPVPQVTSFNDFVELTANMMTTKISAGTKEACRKYYENHNKIMADVISTLELRRVKGFILNCHKLSGEFAAAFDESPYSTINDFVDSLPESDLRKIAKGIGDKVVSFFETTP